MRKSKVLKFSVSEEQELLRVRLGSEGLGEVSEFAYLGSMVSVEGIIEAELKHKLEKGSRIMEGWLLVGKQRNGNLECWKAWWYLQ